MTASSPVRDRPTPCLTPRVGMAPETARAARFRLEAVLASYRLSFPKVRDPRVEWAAFPSMIGLYWGLVEADARGMPPTQAAFADAVAGRLPRLPGDAVKARAHRTYPAFVRQHHFELVLRERFPLVLRGHVLDLAGLDFLIIDSGSAYGLALSVDTTTAHEWVQRKQHRHAPMPDIPILELYADEDVHRAGAIWLHHPNQVEEVSAFIERQWHLTNRYC
jgi:hypothetical protein